MIRRAFLRAAFAAAACGMLGVELGRRRPEVEGLPDVVESMRAALAQALRGAGYRPTYFMMHPDDARAFGIAFDEDPLSVAVAHSTEAHAWRELGRCAGALGEPPHA